jgi:hypothetical protein
VKLGLAHDWRRRATAGQGMAMIRDERARVTIASGLASHPVIHCI